MKLQVENLKENGTVSAFFKGGFQGVAAFSFPRIRVDSEAHAGSRPLQRRKDRQQLPVRRRLPPFFNGGVFFFFFGSHLF